MFGHVDWSHRGDYIVASHDVTPSDADEALADPERIVIRPDYNSTSGRSVRIIGFSQSVGGLTTVIVLEDEGVVFASTAGGRTSETDGSTTKGL